MHKQPFTLPQIIHDGGSGKISITVPSFDDATFLLLAPHHLYLAINPICYTMDRKFDCKDLKHFRLHRRSHQHCHLSQSKFLYLLMLIKNLQYRLFDSA
jgi:hypothetical protein